MIDLVLKWHPAAELAGFYWSDSCESLHMTSKLKILFKIPLEVLNCRALDLGSSFILPSIVENSSMNVYSIYPRSSSSFFKFFFGTISLYIYI